MRSAGGHNQLLQQQVTCPGWQAHASVLHKQPLRTHCSKATHTNQQRSPQLALHIIRTTSLGNQRVVAVQASIHNGSEGNTVEPSKRSDVVSSNIGSRCPVLILPGFLSNNTTAEQSQYRELANNLLALGHPAAEILPATTWDWLPTLSGGSFKWYIQRLAAAVQQLFDKYNSQVCLVGISAGGWLARLALGSTPYHGRVYGLAPKVHTLVTCGTPHQSMEAYPFGRAEEAWLCDLPEEMSELTKGRITTSLQYTNHFYPDADSLKPTNLVCVVGNATKGEAFDMTEVGLQVITGRLPLNTANDRWFVQSAYLANCGEVGVEGDGVCPVETATVPGATTLVLPDVWHNKEPGKLWYGSMEVVQQWDKFLP